MSRETMRVRDEHDSLDVAAFTALWDAAPFARLPEDAPLELKKLTIEIKDPRRVYSIHKATRRHHFQVLLDRFIHQIRYGCTYKACSTTTCFSCRKRLADGAPVRRYNATSARALAFYMISLDNPEQGLCHHPAAPRPNEKNKVSAPRNLPLSDDPQPSCNPEVKSNIRKTSPDTENFKKVNRKASVEKIPVKEADSKISLCEEQITTDHRSFVQNMFETVAIKMVEWMTPRSIESLIDIQKGSPTESNSGMAFKKKETTEISPVPVKSEVQFTLSDESDKKKPESLKNSGAIKESKLRPASENISNCSALPLHLGPNVKRRTKSPESSGFKGIINKMPREQPLTDKIAPPHRLSSNILKGKPIKQTLITNPDIPVPNFDELTIPSYPSLKSCEIMVTKEKTKQGRRNSLDESQENTIITPHKKENIALQSENSKLPPQSLRSFTIETIELMCNILQMDGTCEKHFLHPSRIGAEYKRHRSIHPQSALQRNSLFQEMNVYPNSAKQQWKAFIEQCFFDVLRRPKSLLQSFSDGNKKFFDSPTIWYLMLRMTRVAPTLVFDSLWNVAGTLFRPPKKLETSYERTKELSYQKSQFKKAIPNRDAADIVCICFHALIAAAPLVEDTRQLTNMSRIRSYGLTMLARDLNSSDSSALCFQYEDAFTNELALRLARRVFMAISTRRIFSESLQLQKIHDDAKQEPDILDTILSHPNCLSSGSRLVMDFSDTEQDVHKKRVPIIILDWARTVMLQDWQGGAEVPSDGSFGGALTTIAAIHKNRQSFNLSDIHFYTEYFSERLDSINMPIEWLSFNPNKKTVHLLDYPYLFSPATLISYFRAINYSKMNLAHETAKSESVRINSTMHENSLIIDELTRHRLQERLRTATSKFMVMEIRRTHVLLDTFNSIWRREERELMRPLKLRLGEEEGEEGSDSGGVQQEYLRLAIAEALNPDYGTFTIDERTRMTWFQPGSPEPLWKYELIGMIMSLAVFNGLTLPVTFPNALYKKLLGEEVTELHHIADGWPDLANGLKCLLDWDEKNGLIEDVFTRTYEFSVEQFGQSISREMKFRNCSSTAWPQFSLLSQSATLNPSDAPLVTSANRKNYVSDYIHYLTDISIRPQFTAFQNGFFTCISRRSVSLFDAPTLQSLIEGIQVIDIGELRRVTRYIGWEGDTNHHTIKDFWSVVKKYDFEMKRKLLEFVTASDRVPVGGMRGLQFTIQRNGVGDGLLPTSYTCYGILLLPEYSCKDILEKRLAMALENSMGFGFA